MRLTRHTAADVDRELYLRGLDACFGWGGPERFSWCFERVVADRAPDLFLLHDGGAAIAGSAVTYRMLQLPDGTRVRSGIMTGSWTLPQARGRGAFARMIEASLGASPLLVAFSTANNPSSRRLAAAGGRQIASFYCRRATALPPPGDGVRFVYTPEEWRSQFVERPADVELLEAPTWTAAIERGRDSDRVLHVDGDRAEAFTRLGARGRDLFCFATGAPVSSDVTPGFISVFGLDARAWDVQDGDRM